MYKLDATRKQWGWVCYFSVAHSTHSAMQLRTNETRFRHKRRQFMADVHVRARVPDGTIQDRLVRCQLARLKIGSRSTRATPAGTTQDRIVRAKSWLGVQLLTLGERVPTW
jgi:hypothetical protein